MSMRFDGKIFFIYTILGFPLFYFVYKYWTPELGMIDFYDYYKLYKDFDYQNADSPLNMRLVSSFIVFTLQQSGIYYDTQCAIHALNVDKCVYFWAVFSNYLFVVLTALLLYRMAVAQDANQLLGFLAGAVYLFGFGTIFFNLPPLTDAFSTFLFAVILRFYTQRSGWVIVPLALLVFQREYLLLAMTLITFLDWWHNRDRFILKVLVICAILVLIHVILRKSVFETSRYAYHTDLNYLSGSLFSLKFEIIPFLRQLAMTLTIPVLYLTVTLYKKLKLKQEVDKRNLVVFICLVIQLLLLSQLLGLGNNAGRYFYMLSPLVILYGVKELSSVSLT